MELPIRSRPVASSDCLADDLERPDLDNRIYKVIQLPNKLEALLIHDPDTDKASAALDINAGSFSDARDMPGMAHAVEHLLFMGTEKYPKENEYSQYLSAHSGSSNAFTAYTSTNYFFEIAARSDPDDNVISNGHSTDGSTQKPTSSPFYGALDRFAQFFIAPLFLEETLDRELRAVDSENKKNLQSDAWRLNQLSKSLSNPKHPSSGFSTGNLQTLRDEPLAQGVKIRDAFISFYNEQYSANRMKLVVLGREPLEQLQRWVEELFAQVPNKDLPQNRWDHIPVFTEKEVSKQINAKPVMDSRSLEIVFPYMDEEELYATQPSRYLSHLIGHEGPGSILTYVKAKGWVNELSAGSSPLCPGAALFVIDIKLTPEGLIHYKDVVKMVFQYLSILRESPPQEWIFNEVKGMAEVDFKFKQKSPASSTTSSLSQTMQKPLPRKWLLSGEALLRQFDSKAISKAISYLNERNFRLTVVSQEPMQGQVQKEKWYGTEYTVDDLPTDFLAELRGAISGKGRPSELSLPMRNDFIPSRLEVEKKEVKEPSQAPKLIRNEDNVRLWFKKDDQFWVPKANVEITLRTPLSYVTASSAAMSQIFAELVQDSLDEYAYNADIAGLRYDLSTSPRGMHVVVSGYNDKMHVLLAKVLETMKVLEIKDDRFNIIKERLTRNYQNFGLAPPYHQVGHDAVRLATEKSWSVDEYLMELPHITANDVRTFYPMLLNQLHIEMLVHGNVYREDALKLANLVEKSLKPRTLPIAQWPIRRALEIPTGSSFLYSRNLKDPSNVNHCIEYVLSIGDSRDRRHYANLMLLAQMTDEPAFNQLRTKEQLGYVVFSGAVNHVTSAAYRVLIQSERSPEYLEKRIDAFLRSFKKVLADMTDEELESHKKSVINKRLEKLKNLNQECGRFWSHISSEFYRFDEVDIDVAQLKSLKKEEDIMKFYNYYIDPASPTRAKLSLHLLAQGTPAANGEASLSPAEQQEGLLSLMQQYLESQNVKVDEDKLADRLSGLNISGGDQDGIVKALESYLTQDATMSPQQIETIIEQIKPVMGQVLQQLGIHVPLPEEVEDEVPDVNSQPPATIIEDVRAWKASLPLSAGAVPEKDLTEYEELEPKL